MTKINFKTIEDFKDAEQVLFIRPLLCKTVRVFGVSEAHQETGKYNDIIDVLNATATKIIAGVWYYTPPDEDMLHSALQHLSDTLEVQNFLVEEEPKWGRDQQNNPIAEILN